MNKSGIYKIQSILKPNRIYIGSAVNITKRWNHHLDDLRKNEHGNSKLQRHYNKYGESDLQFNILLGCDKIDLLKTEQYFIDSYNPFFNICKTAGSCINIKHSEESRRNMSLSHLGKKQSLETRLKMRENMLGNKRSLGNKQSGETKKKKSDALKGNKNAKGMIPWNKGKGKIKEIIFKIDKRKQKRSPELCEKIRQIQMGNKNALGAIRSPEFRKKISEANLRNGNRPPSRLGMKKNDGKFKKIV